MKEERVLKLEYLDNGLTFKGLGVNQCTFTKDMTLNMEIDNAVKLLQLLHNLLREQSQFFNIYQFGQYGIFIEKVNKVGLRISVTEDCGEKTSCMGTYYYTKYMGDNKLIDGIRTFKNSIGT